MPSIANGAVDIGGQVRIVVDGEIVDALTMRTGRVNLSLRKKNQNSKKKYSSGTSPVVVHIRGGRWPHPILSPLH